jgi:hypothetical protein
MPVLGQVVTRRAKREIVQATNKIQIKDGTRKARIIDVWIFNVDSDGKFTKEKTGEQKVAIKIRFDKRPDIVLEKRMRAYLSPKSRFAQLIQSLTGIEAGSDEMMAFDTDKLVDMDVLVTTEYKEPYTNITTITPREIDDDIDGPAHQPPAREQPRNERPPQRTGDTAFDDDDPAYR